MPMLLLVIVGITFLSIVRKSQRIGRLTAAGVLVGLAVLRPAPTQTPSSDRVALPSQERSNGGTADRVTPASPARRQQIAQAYGKLPLTFEANQGQTERDVQFLAHGNRYSLFLTATEAVLSLNGPNEARRPTRQASALNYRTMSPTSTHTAVLRMALLGSNPNATAVGLEELPGKSNYFIGKDPKQWRTNVPNYARVRFADVYRGVDLVYYGNQRQLEYDFVVAPAADPAAITLTFAGVQGLEIEAHDELVLQSGAGEVRWRKPVIYQDIDGVRQTVSGQYVRRGNRTVGFEIGSYDTHRALVIDRLSPIPPTWAGAEPTMPSASR